MVRVTRGFPHINFRYTVAPTSDVPSAGLIPIKATKEMITEEIGIGYRDGLRAVHEAKELTIENYQIMILQWEDYTLLQKQMQTIGP